MGKTGSASEPGGQVPRSASEQCLAHGKTAWAEEGVLSASCLQTSVQIPSNAEITSDSSDATATSEHESYIVGDD